MPDIHASYIGTMKWIGWMSGTGSPGRERQKRCVWHAGSPPRRGADLALGAEDHRREQMVVQVLADTREVGDDVDPDIAQVIGRPDPGEQQQLRRADRPPAHNDLFRVRAAGRPLDADTTRAAEEEPLRLGACHHFEVAPAPRRYAAATLWRTPSRIVNCMNDTPSCEAPL